LENDPPRFLDVRKGDIGFAGDSDPVAFRSFRGSASRDLRHMERFPKICPPDGLIR
jgi:hypothetical protein